MKDRKNALDPSVADLLSEADKRQNIRRKSRSEQKKGRRDAGRNRVTYDLPSNLEDAISAMAEDEGLSKSATAQLLLAEGVRQFRANKITFNGRRVPARHPLYDWLVKPETITAILAGEIALEE